MIRDWTNVPYVPTYPTYPIYNEPWCAATGTDTFEEQYTTCYNITQERLEVKPFFL